MDKDSLTQAFDYPIPGQSLTARPGNSKWEQPPEMNSVDEVADFFWDRMTEPSAFRDLMRMLDAGVPVNLITSSLVMNGAMEGKYTMDMILLITPIVATQLAFLAKQAGANVEIMKKEDLGINPAPLAKMFAKKTGQTEVVADLSIKEDDAEGLLQPPKGMK